MTTILEVDSLDDQVGLEADRQMLTNLIPHILKLHPRAIVVDTTLLDYRASHWEPYDSVTNNLLDKVHSACQSTAVIFGLDIDNHKIIPRVPIHSNKPGNRCDEGFTNAATVEDDYRFLPLHYKIGNQQYPSLSYAAARQYDRGLPDDPKIQKLWNSETPLFAPLFSRSDYADRTMHDNEVLSNSVPEEIKNKIENSAVIVGFPSGGLVSTPTGPIPEFLLHASYIEAFVRDRLLRQVNEFVHWGIALIFFTWVGWASDFRGQCLRFGVAFGCLVVLEIGLIIFGFYSDFEYISIAGVVVWALLHLHHWLEEKDHAWFGTQL